MNEQSPISTCATSCDEEPPAPVAQSPESTKPGGKEKKNKGEREENTPLGNFLFWSAWVFVLCSVAYSYLAPAAATGDQTFLASATRAGVRELFDFLANHLVSAMIPAFFLAAAISTFFSKETIILALGRKTNPLISYPLAALAGAILTVCSCGILPIFMSILQSGAGLGPAITFLYASPAINLISLIYTWKILPGMLVARVVGVFLSGILIGVLMAFFFRQENDDETEATTTAGKKKVRAAWQEGLFFGLLVLIMLTSTDALAVVTSRMLPVDWFSGYGPEQSIRVSKLVGKLLALVAEALLVVAILRSWFTWDESRKWLKRTYRQAKRIVPMVFLGIFFSGMLGGAPSMVDYLGSISQNTPIANLLASFVGAMLYFGSIVGVNVVDLFHRWGMHQGPALALLLAGPCISLPSVFALIPIIGRKKTAAFLTLVVVFSAAIGFIFGSLK